MDSHSFKDVHDKNLCKNNMDSHSYEDVHDETHKNMDSSLNKDVHDKTRAGILWIVIRKKMCMTKTHKNMDIHSYKDVNQENPYRNNMDIHLYKDVHDKTHMNIYIVMRTKMCMTKPIQEKYG